MPFGDSAPSAVVVAPDASAARRALESGAAAVLRPGASASATVAAEAAARAGLVAIDASFVPALLGTRAPGPREERLVEPLTPREREVLDLIVAGASNRRIARKLSISEHTAKFHVNQILSKLGASTRTEAAVLALRQGLTLL